MLFAPFVSSCSLTSSHLFVIYLPQSRVLNLFSTSSHLASPRTLSLETTAFHFTSPRSQKYSTSIALSLVIASWRFLLRFLHHFHLSPTHRHHRVILRNRSGVCVSACSTNEIATPNGECACRANYFRDPSSGVCTQCDSQVPQPNPQQSVRDSTS